MQYWKRASWGVLRNTPRIFGEIVCCVLLPSWQKENNEAERTTCPRKGQDWNVECGCRIILITLKLQIFQMFGSVVIFPHYLPERNARNLFCEAWYIGLIMFFSLLQIWSPKLLLRAFSAFAKGWFLERFTALIFLNFGCGSVYGCGGKVSRVLSVHFRGNWRLCQRVPGPSPWHCWKRYTFKRSDTI